MNEPLIITHPACLQHQTSRFHPERPDRLLVILEALKGYEIKEARKALEEELCLCHPLSYIHLVKKEIEQGKTMLSTGDVPLSKGSWEAALYAAGAVLEGVDAAFISGRRSFCVIRPPGHHAERARGMGFCLFNNIALGARYGQKKFGIQRVLIADWDLHHGNGTEEIFWDDPSVFYFSTHQHPLYPGTGLSSKEHILNVPISPDPFSRFKVIEAFQTLSERMEQFKPELVMISAGFDAHKSDPLGGLNLEENDYLTLTKILTTIANKHAKGKVVSVLEGGYDLRALANSVKTHVEALS